MSAFACLEISSSPIECHFALLHSMPESEGINTNLTPSSSQNMTDRSWHMNTPAPSPFRGDASVGCVFTVFRVSSYN